MNSTNKKIFILLTSILISTVTLAQRLDVDSMKQVLATQTDTNELKTLVNIAGYYQDNKIDSSLFYAKALLTSSTKRQNIKGMSMAYSYFGQYEYIIGNYPQSILFNSYLKAWSLRKVVVTLNVLPTPITF